MLLNGFFELALDLHLHQALLFVSCGGQVEDAALILALEVTVPEAACLRHELVLHVQVPVLVLRVKLQILAFGHIVDRHDTVIFLHWVVLERQDRVGDHLLQVVDFVHVLGLVPDAVRLVYKDKVLVLRVNHLADVVPVSILEQNEHLHAVGSVRWTHK